MIRRLLLTLVFLCVSSGAWAACVPINAKPGSTGCQPVATSMAGTDYVTVWKPGSFPGSSQIISLNDMLLGRAGFGTVNSVGLQLPNIFNVTGSPVTGTGNLVGALANQNANLGFFGPASGPAAPPGFRAMVPADMPLGTNLAPGALQCDAVTTGCSGGFVSVIGGGVNTTITDGTHSFTAQPTLQFTGAIVSNATGKVIVTISAAATSITGGTTLVSTIPSGGFLYNNSGVLGGIAPGTNVTAAFANALNGTGGLVGYSGNLGTPTAGVGTNFTGIPNAALVNSGVTINGTSVALGGSGTVAAAAGTLTGATLASNVVTSSLTSAAGGSFGTAAYVNTGTSGATLGLLNANLTFGGIDTFLNGNIRMIGSGTGYTTEINLDAGALNYTWSKPAFNGTYLGFATGTPPISGDCAQFSGTGGLVIAAACGSGGSSLTVVDGFGNSTPSVATLTLVGLGCPVGSGAVTCTTTSNAKILPTGSYTVLASDMGNAIIANGSANTIVIPLPGSGLWAGGQTLQMCNESTSSATPITVTSGIVIEPANPASLPIATNNISACVYLTSDGTNLHPLWGGSVPNMPYTNQVQTWTAPQRGNFTSPVISTATFTPVITASQNYRINLVHASCPCTLANPSGTLVAGQQGIIEVAQSATGSDTIGTWGSVYRYGGGTASITLSTTANAVDQIPYAVDSTATYVTLFPIVQAPAH